MKEKVIKAKDFEAWIESLVEKKYRLIAPVKVDGLVLFDEVTSFPELTLDYLITDRPVKEFFFPRTEKVLDYELKKAGIRIDNPKREFPKTVIVGTRPCDSISLSLLDKVFSAEYKDEFFLGRREATTLVSISCHRFDDSCFCTSVGYSPKSTEGSDLLLTEEPDGDFQVNVITDKGEALISESGTFFGEVKKGKAKKQIAADPPVRFDRTKLKSWLDNNFDSDFWKEISLKCLGCASCSYLCPTCHCFDIQDETTYERGERLRNWDCCSFGLFTLHASGHNPRPTQASRYRQRIMHKFKYYVENFETGSCVGCGRCLRSCPVGMNFIENLSQIAEAETKS